MGHCPRKVFIKENGTYVALSYEAFCKRRLQNPEDRKRLFLPVQGCLLETDRETYYAFYRAKERTRYLKSLEREIGVLSLENVDLDREIVHSPFHDTMETLAELVLSRQLTNQLRRAVSRLTPAEKELIFLLYYENHTERELAERYGVCRNAIHKRKIRVLKKLKNFLEE